MLSHAEQYVQYIVRIDQDVVDMLYGARYDCWECVSCTLSRKPRTTGEVSPRR